MSSKVPRSSEPVKKGISSFDHRRRREDKAIALRREQREEGIEKRRRTPPNDPSTLIVSEKNGQCPDNVVDIANLNTYCELARSEDPEKQLQGVRSIRRLMAMEHRPPVEEILANNILERVVSLISSDNPTIAFEAAWTVTNVASTQYTSKVIEAGAIYPLVKGMINADANVRDQCIWCLGNIAGDSTQYRDMLITYPGVLQALLMNIQHPATDVLLRNATWSLSNFCRGKSSMDLRAAKCIISALTWLVGLDDIQIVADACWGFSYLTSGDKEIMQMVVDTKIAKRCVELIGTSDSRVVTPALRVIGNIVTGNTEQTQSALDAGCLEALVPLIMKGKRGIRKQAIWIVSNIAAGSKEQINSIFATPHLMELIFSHVLDSDWFIRKEAMWVLTNITMTRHPSHLETLVQYGVLNTLVQFLSCSDARMICTVLDAISVYLSYSSLLVKNPHENGSNQYGVLLEEAGLVDILEELLSSDFTDVFYKAENLLEKYFQNSDMSPSMNLSTTNTAGIAVYGNLSESNAHTMHPSNLELQFGSMPLQEAPFIDDNIHAASRMQVPTGPDADYSHAYNMEGVTIASYPHTVTNFTTDGPIESFPFGMDHFAPPSSGPSIPPAIRPQSLAHSDNNSTLAPDLVPSTSTNAQSTRTVPSKLSTFRQPFGVREAQNTVSNMHHPVLSDVSGVKSVRIASMGSKNDQATGSFQYGVL